MIVSEEEGKDEGKWDRKEQKEKGQARQLFLSCTSHTVFVSSSSSQTHSLFLFLLLPLPSSCLAVLRSCYRFRRRQQVPLSSSLPSCLARTPSYPTEERKCKKRERKNFKVLTRVSLLTESTRNVSFTTGIPYSEKSIRYKMQKLTIIYYQMLFPHLCRLDRMRFRCRSRR